MVAWLASSTAIMAAWAWSAVATGDTVATEASGTVSTTSSSGSSGSSSDTSSDSSASSDTSTGTTDATQGTTDASTDASATDGTYTGDAVSTKFGDVQVQVTVSGGTITDVTALALPSRDGHSARISQQVEEPLASAALQAQSADISIISGATYTSRGYAQSLQSALDQAGL
ncbi:hypothetical protein ARHIZOSPH14_22800 [Agromyces rhizosphaerae]|uniref:FMN-binding domain-containing protein n=1 Tax=Agromyces rhizosphaerae TaxID=88374 RepID=A0A9W6FSD3_9MICO|nr:hypothetical protein ARHIZOSPH14_22800 [Agromyces rhizosphaerae]